MNREGYAIISDICVLSTQNNTLLKDGRKGLTLRTGWEREREAKKHPKERNQALC